MTINKPKILKKYPFIFTAMLWVGPLLLSAISYHFGKQQQVYAGAQCTDNKFDEYMVQLFGLLSLALSVVLLVRVSNTKQKRYLVLASLVVVVAWGLDFLGGLIQFCFPT